MYNKEQHDTSMTIFYSKSSGDIKGYATGIQDMTYYGDNAEDFSLIWDYLVLTKDENVLNNIAKFTVNVETNELELLPEYAFRPEQYKIAGGDE